MHIEVPAVPYQELRGKDDGVSSTQMRERVLRARDKQQRRGFYNSAIPVSQLRGLCALDEAGERTLEMAVRRMGFSARARPHPESGAYHLRPRWQRTRQRQASGRSRPIPQPRPQLLDIELVSDGAVLSRR